jgi:hypothetical protein
MNSEDAEIWEEALISVIKKEIGSSAVNVIKERLLEKYGTTIRQSFPKWALVEDILRENFGDGYITINSKLISEVTKRGSKYTPKTSISEIKNSEVIKLVGDPEIAKMLNQVFKDAKIIKEIIKDSKVTQTTAYRKIEKMKEFGLLVECGFIISPKKKKIIKYTFPYKSLSIEHKNGISVIRYGPKKILKIN